MRKIIFGLSVLVSIQLSAQQTIKGIVFEDINQNGRLDKNEKGLENVAVSNGMDVVLTDAKGRYTLSIKDDNHVFVIKPSRYKTPLDSYFLPKFYYTHKPKGSPKNFKYSGVEPTPVLPKSVDFPLIPQQENTTFTAFVFGDPQTYTDEELVFFQKAIVEDAQQHKQGVSFGISLGDLVGDDLLLQPKYKKQMSALALPWYNVMGNHDMNYDATTDELSDETFEKNFGPTTYAFNYANAHFLILDNILYPNPRGGKGYLGGFRQDQLAFIKNDLKTVSKDKLIVLSFHIPIFLEGEDHFDNESRQQLLEILKDYPNILMLSAHTHYQMHQFYDKEKGWKGAQPLHEYNVGTTSGDWYSGELNEEGVPVSTMRDGTPRGYAYLTVKDNRYELDYKVAGKPLDYKMDIYTPKVIANKGWNTSLVFANIFMGSEKDEVEIRFGNGKWQKMDKTIQNDPRFYYQVQRWDNANELLMGRRPSNPVQSSHLWYKKLPNNLGLGEHTIEVRVRDMFGRTYTNTATYRIEEKKPLTN
ncbi:calcineurin-like phosphoesterase C-terminal domain-containing protein [Vaginella massiliensis]|uniref:calcineurin-like phosphoesterase C-terminal domain-containing protein n=1 Tax=Vaginella massiliensis TaxID=1816680 RepID=UPI003751501B